MDCTKAEAQLSFYVYDELDDGARGPLMAHLQVCGKCTRRIEEYKVAKGCLEQLPAPEVPGDFLVGVRARLERPETWAERLESRFEALGGPRLSVAAGFGALALGAFFVGQLSGDWLAGAPPVPAAVIAQAQPAGEGSGPGVVTPPGLPLEGASETGPEGNPAASDAPGAPGVTPPGAEGALRLASAEGAADVPGTRRESFDDVFGPGEAAPAEADGGEAAAGGASPVAAKPAAPKPVAEPPVRLAAAPPPKPREAGRRDLDRMGAAELDAELARLGAAARPAAPPPPPRVGKRPEGLSIFRPSAGAGDRLLAKIARPDRASGGVPRDSAASIFMAGDEPAAARDLVPLSWVRGTFGGKVRVLEAEDFAELPRVARDLEVQSPNPRQLLAGIRDLVAAGAGLDLKQVDYREGEGLALVLGCGRGPRGQQTLARFLGDLQSLGSGEVVSESSQPVAGDREVVARVSLTR